MLSIASLRCTATSTLASMAPGSIRFSSRGARHRKMPRLSKTQVKELKLRETDSPSSKVIIAKRFYGPRPPLVEWLLSPDHAVLLLVAANIAVTLKWQTADDNEEASMRNHYMTSPIHLDDGYYHTLLTSVFSHSETPHLLTNMLVLYVFGNRVAHALGFSRFLGVYLASGVASNGAALLEQKHSRRLGLSYGASGAVCAVTTLSVLLFPRARVRMFGIVPIPAWAIGAYLVGRDFKGWRDGKKDGIGYFAHLSGSACGAVYYAYSIRRGLRILRS